MVSQVGVRPFENSMDHLLAEMALLDSMLFRHVRQVRSRNTAQAGNDFEGLFVSEQGIDVILSQSPIVRDVDETSSDPSITAIQQQREMLTERTSISSQKGGVLAGMTVALLIKDEPRRCFTSCFVYRIYRNRPIELRHQTIRPGSYILTAQDERHPE